MQECRDRDASALYLAPTASLTFSAGSSLSLLPRSAGRGGERSGQGAWSSQLRDKESSWQTHSCLQQMQVVLVSIGTSLIARTVAQRTLNEAGSLQGLRRRVRRVLSPDAKSVKTLAFPPFATAALTQAKSRYCWQ